MTRIWGYTIAGLDWWTGPVDWTGGLDTQLNFRIFSCTWTFCWLETGERPAYDCVVSPHGPSQVLLSPTAYMAPNPWPSLYSASRDFYVYTTLPEFIMELPVIAIRPRRGLGLGLD